MRTTRFDASTGAAMLGKSVVSAEIDPAASSNHDKAGKSYWDLNYSPEYAPPAVDPRDPGLRNFVERQFHDYFRKTLSSLNGGALLEIGCGGSRYLPYFSKEFGIHVSGIDYSEAGCASASRILAREGVPGQIVCADFFDPPPSLFERFDVVVSMGVVEHFADTAGCLRAVTRFVKPEGLVLTFVPKMVGLIGSLQKFLDRQLFDKHVPLDKELLRQAHEQANLVVEDCDYFLFNHFFVVGMNQVAAGTFEWYLKASLLKSLHCLSGAIWALETAFHPFRPGRFMSPFIACTARKRKSACSTNLESGFCENTSADKL
jgi:2-polyprenyl-3-methyl-5-hydroxy-6-metoxy-1,4-benzoquinol methylase